MDDRPYLSIGDVLALLQREFPDVTISKIRFLESRGLLVPERTPSGYRKFYEHDVERLRWILRQQREHFLPLKVIKGRLEGQDTSRPPTLFEMGEPAPDSAIGRAEDPSQDREGDEAVDAPAAEQAEAVSASGTGGAADPDASAGASRFAYSNAGRNGVERSAGGGVVSSLPTRPLASGGPEGSPQGVSATTSSGRTDVSGGPAHSAHRAEPRLEMARLEPTTSGVQAAPAEGRAAGGDPAEPAPASAPASSRSTASAPGQAAQPVAEEARAPSRRASAERASTGSGASAHELAALAGVSLTAGELAQASGLEVQQVADLESYGLIEARTVAGVRCYDEEALVVAGLAASLTRFGVEARHLRVFKYAAERQTGLYSQIVLPLLRQRNPEARRRALDDVKQLSELGSLLQASFAKAALRDLTGA